MTLAKKLALFTFCILFQIGNPLKGCSFFDVNKYWEDYLHSLSQLYYTYKGVQTDSFYSLNNFFIKTPNNYYILKSQESFYLLNNPQWIRFIKQIKKWNFSHQPTLQEVQAALDQDIENLSQISPLLKFQNLTEIANYLSLYPPHQLLNKAKFLSLPYHLIDDQVLVLRNNIWYLTSKESIKNYNWKTYLVHLQKAIREERQKNLSYTEKELYESVIKNFNPEPLRYIWFQNMFQKIQENAFRFVHRLILKAFIPHAETIETATINDLQFYFENYYSSLSNKNILFLFFRRKIYEYTYLLDSKVLVITRGFQL